MNRREFGQTGILGLSALSLFGTLGCRGRTVAHPWMFVTATPVDGLRSVGSLVDQLPIGHTRVLWERILRVAREDLSRPPITPGTPLPDRTAETIRKRNPDFVVVHAAGQRVLRHALVQLLVNEDGHKEAALRQMAVLFDRDTWPMWLDQGHVRFGHPAGLRTGMLGRDIGLAYDWLYQSLNENQRQVIVDGLDDQAIQPFLTSVEQDPWWMQELNNWLTTIVGGLGIAGMALGDAHPDSGRLVELAIPQFERYMSIYGEAGEFNESVAYANSTERPVSFYGALRYATSTSVDKLASDQFLNAGRWMQYLTLPPGRIAAFGDGHLYARPWVRHFAAIASATRDRLLQWYYINNAREEPDALELLWYDGSLSAQSPGGILPLGRAFVGHGACVSSRTSWDPISTHCVVYGKASREENHEHNDDGQVCIDGFGDRLIVDLGSPSGYPEDFFERERWNYYNASVRGHNVIMVGNRELRTLFRERGQLDAAALSAIHGRFIDYSFDDAKGGFWRMDLTRAHEQVVSVRRTVVHALPAVVVVVDDVELPDSDELSLRWHTVDKATPSVDGSFIVKSEKAVCYSRVVGPPGVSSAFARKEHQYTAPFDRDRDGATLEQRNESYVEATCVAKTARFVSLFAVEPAGHLGTNWLEVAPTEWVFQSDAGVVSVQTQDNRVSIFRDDQAIWEVDLF